MKTKLALFLLMVATFTLVLCKKSDTNEEPLKLTYLTTELGGCNHPASVQNKTAFLNEDTVKVSVQNDSISIFVGLAYVCCAPFESCQEIKNDSILISIRDTCPNPYHSCYCRCRCYYTFDFRFVQSGQGNIHYKIELFDPLQPTGRVVRKGTISQTHSI